MSKFFLLFLFIPSSLFPCTDFNLISTQNEVVVARSMEFEIDLQTQLVFFPSGQWQQSISKEEKNPAFRWQKKYSYLAMTSFGPTLATDGMNEKGLSVGALWFVGATYPSFQTGSKEPVQKPLLALQDLGHWILSSFSTVDEVREGFQTVAIVPMVIEQLNQMPPIHLAIHDAQGKSLVIEFIDQAIHLFDNPLGVLTNAPSLPWHLDHLRNYLSLSPVTTYQKQIGPLSFMATGQGTGLVGMPGDWTPPSRFIRAALLKAFSIPPKNSHGLIILAFHLLNVLDIPYGVIRSTETGISPNGRSNVDYTQWVVVKDLTNKKLYYRTYDNLQVQTISLLEEMEKEGSTPRVLSHLLNPSLSPSSSP